MLGSASELYHATREINAAHQAKAHPLEQSQEFESNVLGVGRVVRLAQIRTIEFNKPRTDSRFQFGSDYSTFSPKPIFLVL